jgi:hypothetical protein
MKGQFYGITRDLHLYLGLFISPFVLVFQLRCFFLVHAWLPKLTPTTSTTFARCFAQACAGCSSGYSNEPSPLNRRILLTHFIGATCPSPCNTFLLPLGWPGWKFS